MSEHPVLTLNEIAVALAGIQIAAGWARKQGRSKFWKAEIAKYREVNIKLSRILDQFALPENEDGERPDNGEDKVILMWERSVS